jgi:hypothetical protein
VSRWLPIGADRLAALGATQATRAHFVFKTADNSSRLLDRTSATTTANVPWDLVHYWRIGDEWWGAGEGIAPKVWRGLGTEQFRPVPDAVNLDFDESAGELLLRDAKGAAVHRLRPETFILAGPAIKGTVLPVPRVKPHESGRDTPRGQRPSALFLRGTPDCCPLLSTSHGVWLIETPKCAFISHDDAVRLATSPEGSALNAANLNEATPKPLYTQAWDAMSHNQVDQAEGLLKELLKKQPRDDHGLLLSAMVVRKKYPNRPELTDEFYRQLAKSDRPDAALTGEWHLLLRAVEQQNWREVLAIEAGIRKRFPLLSEQDARELTSHRAQAAAKSGDGK